jgi:hypothetical protein
MQNQSTFGQNVGFLIKSSQSRRKLISIGYYIRKLFRPGFRHIVQAWQIPRVCRVCPALAPVKHKSVTLAGWHRRWTRGSLT